MCCVNSWRGTDISDEAFDPLSVLEAVQEEMYGAPRGAYDVYHEWSTRDSKSDLSS